MSDKIQTQLEKRNLALQTNRDKQDRWFRKLSRATKALENLRSEERRLLKPRGLNDHEKLPGPLKVKSSDWHRIRDMELSDEIPDFLRRT